MLLKERGLKKRVVFGDPSKSEGGTEVVGKKTVIGDLKFSFFDSHVCYGQSTQARCSSLDIMVQLCFF